MKRLILIMIISQYACASEIEEAMLISCQGTGHALYSSCVVVPPVTPEQVAFCTSLLTQYTACSTTLNQPEIMVLSKDPDPYSWSPYDPCRFEVQHHILGDICPNTPAGY